MRDLHIPGLTFEGVEYGRLETKWNLRPLLYRGGAIANVREAIELIAQGALGEPIANRIPLVKMLFDEIQGDLTGGGSRDSAQNRIHILRRFYAWSDAAGRSPTVETIASDFLEYAEYLLHRERVEAKSTPISTSHYARVAVLFDRVLNRKVPLLKLTRIREPVSKKRVLGTEANKQNLERTFAFGRALLDISDALTVDAMRAPLPIRINFRTGQTYEEWGGLRPTNRVKALSANAFPSTRETCIRRRAKRHEDTSYRTRYPLINLRIEAELLIFVAQTGMNLTQAGKIKAGKFRYQSHLDGYRVCRTHKGRKRGEVEFEIYSEYRTYFERYVEWRRTIFPHGNEDLLFPFLAPPGKTRNPRRVTNFDAIQRKCNALNVKYFGPRAIRNTRVNWLLRRLGDPELTAEMAQHTQETLLRQYEQPNHQFAIIEISRFHAGSDPAFAMPGPGICIRATPERLSDAPPHAPTPDCASPSGCLFCVHQRDLDSFDYVWSLATHRHLKSVELARAATGNSVMPHPAEAAVERTTRKLKWFKASSEVRALWVTEALARIAESDYHPMWDGHIEILEARK